MTIEVVGDEPGLLSADGRESLELPVGGRVHDRTGADRPARLVRREDAPPFHELLRGSSTCPADDDGAV